ncbi:hypothetical protein H7J55_18655 [Mycolicibacterium brisbanense]|uniref:Lipoprotein LpqQ n=2 Tax=Mycolicibacterium brisbanense TaxID=146020 RepID=A0A117I7Y3_9MYCO|nr:hypothetical protein [Mycolicibacterium brisbanense]GAS92280.1 lipoprotein LpqQ [Mycolicibacterium brisbanense]
MRQISGIQGFEAPNEPDHGERTVPVAITDTSAPCRAVYDQQTVFGHNWTQFRSVTYAAAIPHPLIDGSLMLTQNVAVYPDSVASGTAFSRVVAAIPGCLAASASLDRRTERRPDSNTVLLYGDLGDDAYRLNGATLIHVSTVGPSERKQFTQEILDQLEHAQP